MTMTLPAAVPQFTQGDRLRKAREVAGYDTFKEFADAIGLHPNTVANLENGKHRARKIVLKAWSDVTGVPLEWLEGVTSDYKATVRPRQGSTFRNSSVTKNSYNTGPSARARYTTGHTPR